MAKQVFSNETIKRLLGILDSIGLSSWYQQIQSYQEDNELPKDFDWIGLVKKSAAIALSQISVIYHDSLLYHHDFMCAPCVTMRKNMAFLLRIIKD